MTGFAAEIWKPYANTGAINAKVQGPSARPAANPRTNANNPPLNLIDPVLSFKPFMFNRSRKNKPAIRSKSPVIILLQIPISPSSLPSDEVIRPIINIVASIPKENKSDNLKGEVPAELP